MKEKNMINDLTIWHQKYNSPIDFQIQRHRANSNFLTRSLSDFQIFIANNRKNLRFSGFLWGLHRYSLNSIDKARGLCYYIKMTKEEKDFFNLLYEEYDQEVRLWCWHILHNDDDTKDARNEAWTGFFKAARGFSHFFYDGYPIYFEKGDKDYAEAEYKAKRDEVKKYLVTCANSKSKNLYNKRKNEIDIDDPTIPPIVSPCTDLRAGWLEIMELYPDLSLYDQDANKTLMQFIQYIAPHETDRNRKIIYLHYGLELTLERIGEIVGLGKSQVKNIIDRFTEQVRQKSHEDW